MRGTCAALIGLVVVGCASGTRSEAPAGRGSAQRTSASTASGAVPAGLVALSDQVLAAVQPCVTSAVDALVDHDAFAREMTTHAPAMPPQVAAFVRTGSLAASKLCAWIGGAERVEHLRFGHRDGESLVVLRAVTASGTDYYELRAQELAGRWRIRDVYAYTTDLSLSAYFAELLLAPSDVASASVMNDVNRLDRAGRPAEALARLDQLGPAMLANRAMQSQRVGFASRISIPVYLAALDERRRVLPSRTLAPSEQFFRAMLTGDHAAALASVDELQGRVGADPAMLATRAGILAARGGVGDLERAAALEDEAVAGAPTVRWTHLTKAVVAVARQDWAGALAALDGLRTHLGVRLTEAELRAAPGLAPLVETPAYAAWHE